MKSSNLFLCLIICITGISSCFREATPYSGVYISEDSAFSAIVIDSSLCIMNGKDTAHFYDLHFKDEIFLPDLISEDEKIYVFGVTFSYSINRLGINNIESNFNFNTNKNYGNTVIAKFKGNHSLKIGDMNYKRPLTDEIRNEILNSYGDLITNNFQYNNLNSN